MRSLACLCVAVFLSGCAVFKSENRRLLNLLDTELAPAPGTAAILFSPVTLPVGVAGLALDMVVVHPVASIDDAWLDTRAFLWESEDETAFRKVVMAPVSVLLTPVVFAGDWLGRSLFAFPARTTDERSDGGKR